MTLPTALGPGREFDQIRAIWQRLGSRVRGVGDDAAIVTIGAERLALSCDLAVEDHHFKLDWLAPAELGWRATAAALSDLAAVAAEPAGVLASVGVPAERAGAFLTEVMDGVGNAAASVGAAVWGGDLVQCDRVILDLLVVGRVREAPVLRHGARPGDGVWVTGRLGAPHEAVQGWLAGTAPAPGARARYAHPVPRVREARWLAERGATAMIDVSDGLVGDAGHVAAASEVAITIESEQVPLHSGAREWRSAVIGGEEYELLVALPPGFGPDDAAAFAAAFDVPLTRVGAVAAGGGVTVRRGGQAIDVAGGFSHF
ncbi:MAG: thiamine-phosphate kinase [Gemmatimonadota bacterium]|nr:thiamine-phosphate kinase [Gemmatimonadota bacterium]